MLSIFIFLGYNNGYFVYTETIVRLESALGVVVFNFSTEPEVLITCSCLEIDFNLVVSNFCADLSFIYNYFDLCVNGKYSFTTLSINLFVSY